MEAFHYRYHPLAKRMREIVDSGELGKIRHVEAAMCFPLPRFSDIRYNYDLAGGATMDTGCYAVHVVRMLGREEPQVVSAKARLHNPDVDRAMTAELRFPSGHTGRVTTSIWSSQLMRMNAHVVGEKGELTVLNPYMPQLFHRLTVRVDGKRRVERFDKRPSYAYQLDAFTAAVLRGEPILTPAEDGLANMTVIDAIYAAAGLRLRSA
jgi:predicted dehydrogenase